VPRLLPLSDDPVGRTARSVFDEIAEPGGAIPPIYRLLAYSPAVLRAWKDFAWPLRQAIAVPPDVRELVILRVAHLSGSARQTRHHRQLALESGQSAAKIDALAEADIADRYDPGECAALRLADEMVAAGRVADATFAAVLEAFGPEQTIEIVVVIAYYRCLADVLNALDLN
jgi:alkylhydroperoxidase family enzyme